jgi:hypothetical protein
MVLRIIRAKARIILGTGNSAMNGGVTGVHGHHVHCPSGRKTGPPVPNPALHGGDEAPRHPVPDSALQGGDEALPHPVPDSALQDGDEASRHPVPNPALQGGDAEPPHLVPNTTLQGGEEK